MLYQTAAIDNYLNITIQWPKEKGQTIIYNTLHRTRNNTNTTENRELSQVLRKG
jgi:hypothetical protein